MSFEDKDVTSSPKLAGITGMSSLDIADSGLVALLVSVVMLAAIGGYAYKNRQKYIKDITRLGKRI